VTASKITVETHGPLATLAIDCRPDPNYLDEPLLAAIITAIASLNDDPAVRSICLQGQAEGFLLGVDLSFFVECLTAGEMDRVLSFTRAAHGLLAEFERSPKPIAAWIRGGAMGAGLELALACKRIVAAPTAKFAFPETGLGIYPGMGGTQRLPRRIGVGLAKWMIYTGAILPAPQALEIGLIDRVHPTATTAAEALQALDAPAAGATSSGTRFRTLDELFASNDVATLSKPSFATSTDPHAVRAVVQMRGKAPLALVLAEQIIDRGMTLPLTEAIEEEFAHLGAIFATEDARAGLLSVGKQRPQFVGR
jgi:enoyl-CoA hydratase / 3-hydroxyacyl-CoA dehydrogenase